MSDKEKLIQTAEELVITSAEVLATVRKQDVSADPGVAAYLARSQQCIEESRALLERLRTMTPPPK